MNFFRSGGASAEPRASVSLGATGSADLTASASQSLGTASTPMDLKAFMKDKPQPHAGDPALRKWGEQGGGDALDQLPDTILHGVQTHHIREAFDCIDVDRNGFIGASELRHILLCSGVNPKDEEIDEMIRMLDNDGDGQITYQEYESLFRTENAVLSEMLVRKPKAVVQKQEEDALEEEGEKVRKGMLMQKGLGALFHASKKNKEAVERSSTDMSRSRSNDNIMEAAAAGVVTGDLAGGTGEMNPLGSKLKPSFVKKIYKKFKEVDKDGSGSIDYAEFCMIMEQEDTPIMKRMFEMFDSDHSGLIEMKEFMVGLAGFTTADRGERTKFAFMMFDEDGSGFIERHELAKILKANFMSSKADDQDINRRTDKILRTAGQDPRTGKLDFAQFCEISNRTPGLMFPAFTLMGKVDVNLGEGRVQKF